LLESPPRRFYSPVYVLCTSFLDGSDFLLSGGVDGVEGATTGRIYEFAINQELSEKTVWSFRLGREEPPRIGE
jgi:hypothetical protein